MKRDLIKQMCNEWRENIWLVLELFIVLVAIWIFCVQMLSSVVTYNQPKGFDATNVYVGRIWVKYDVENGYTEFGENTDAINGEDLVKMLNRYRNSPYVEHAGYAYNGTPYAGGWYGTSFNKDGDTVPISINWRFVSPDIAEVLQYESLTGQTPKEMADLLRKGEALVAPSKDYTADHDPMTLLNTPLILNHTLGDSLRYYSHALIRPVLTSEFDTHREGNFITPMTDDMIRSGWYNRMIGYLLIKVKQGDEKELMDQFYNNREFRELRNVSIESLTPMSTIRKNTIEPDLIKLRIFIGATVFLLIIVFLGLLGTFRYRVSRRESEIAIRKVAGATSGDILRRLLTEGMLLLCFALIPAIIIAAIYDHRNPDFELSAYIYPAGGLAFLIILITIFAGILIPGLLAMKVQPATALKDE